MRFLSPSPQAMRKVRPAIVTVTCAIRQPFRRYRCVGILPEHIAQGCGCLQQARLGIAVGDIETAAARERRVKFHGERERSSCMTASSSARSLRPASASARRVDAASSWSSAELRRRSASSSRGGRGINGQPLSVRPSGAHEPIRVNCGLLCNETFAHKDLQREVSVPCELALAAGRGQPLQMCDSRERRRKYAFWRVDRGGRGAIRGANSRSPPRQRWATGEMRSFSPFRQRP